MTLPTSLPVSAGVSRLLAKMSPPSPIALDADPIVTAPVRPFRGRTTRLRHTGATPVSICGVRGVIPF